MQQLVEGVDGWWDFLDARAIPWRKGVMAVRFHEVLKRSDKNLGSFERTNKPSIPRLPKRNERKFIHESVRLNHLKQKLKREGKVRAFLHSP